MARHKAVRKKSIDYPFLGRHPLSLTPEEYLEYEMAKAQGLPILLDNDRLVLATSLTPYRDEIYCFVDIETTSSKPQNSYIIEIGAIKVKNGEILDTFESFGWAPEVPNMITDVTGITTDMISQAPKQFQLLKEFRLFLGDAVFVAHNISFDYDYVSSAMNQTNLGKLHNRKLCTIDLAKRTILSEKYGLKHLSDHLQLTNENHHRAFNDAKVSMEIFYTALQNLPTSLYSTEDLIDFTQTAPVLQMTYKETPSRKTVQKEECHANHTLAVELT